MLEDHNPIFGKNVIETLSEGMYDNPLFLFREYVQNAADALDAAKRAGILQNEEGQIEIFVEPNKRLITFEDNGIGIPKDSVKKMLANIGDSLKDRKIDKGFRGIGRLGGLGYCRKVRFETSAQGEPIKSFLEWDAKKLHEILANKNDHTDAGSLIKRITSTWEESCPVGEHYFKVSLLEVNDSNVNDLLDIEDIRHYLSMVAPLPFDYAKFRFVKEIEKFINENNLPALHEYRLSINGDEVRKGYETPLKIEEESPIDILGVECRLIRAKDRVIGWYWFCVSKFEGVLPKKCWQRGIRLRKANIQIGEADCLSNHPKRGQALWREDRGNNYFIGEIHAIDEDLIPNSRRDYFNQDEACRRFEAALQSEFRNLHDLYHHASAIRSASLTIEAAKIAKEEFDTKERKRAFYDKVERTKAAEKVNVAVQKAQTAQRVIEKIKEKVQQPPRSESEIMPIAHVLNSYVRETMEVAVPTELAERPQKGFVREGIKKQINVVLEVVFDVLHKQLPEDEAEKIKKEILKRFIRR